MSKRGSETADISESQNIKTTQSLMKSETVEGDAEKSEEVVLQKEDSHLFVSSSESFKHLLHQVGSYNKWQLKLFFITSFCGFFTSVQNLSAAFIAATPEHWCHIAILDKFNASFDLRNGSIPWLVDSEGKGSYSSCKYYDRNWTALVAAGLTAEEVSQLPTNGVPTKSCQEWSYDHSVYKTTAVEDWDLVCTDKYRMSLIQSTYMAGVLTGAVVLSELADKFGRRTISLISVIGFILSSISVAFITDYTLFLILRFLVAAFTSGLFLPNFVILMESVGRKGRSTMGILYQGFFAIGFTMLPWVAYFVNEWRSLQLTISVPGILMVLYYWILPESPRWLMLQGRYEEAFAILRNVAKSNGRAFPPKEELDAVIESFDRERTSTYMEKTSILQKFINFFRSIIILLSTPNMRRRCLIIFFAWFVVSMVYYGLTFSGGNINASPYLLVFFSGAVEIPSYILVCWTLKRFGRRLNLCGLFTICGTACLLILAVPKDMVWMNITLASVGKFFNSGAFAVAYVYSAELVPTGVRNISVGTSSMCARIGSALAPFIVDLLGELHYAVPSTVFGLLSVSAGLLTLLLPETGNSNLPETVADVENLPR